MRSALAKALLAGLMATAIAVPSAAQDAEPDPIAATAIAAPGDVQKAALLMLEITARLGSIQKVTLPGQYPHVWVRQPFLDADFDEKAKLAGYVYLYYFGSEAGGMVLLDDARTGREIGRFRPHHLEIY